MRQIVRPTCFYLSEGLEQLWSLNFIDGTLTYAREDIVLQTPFYIVRVVRNPSMQLLAIPLPGNCLKGIFSRELFTQIRGFPFSGRVKAGLQLLAQFIALFASIA